MLLELLSVRSGFSNLASETSYNDLETFVDVMRRCVNVYVRDDFLKVFWVVFTVLRVRTCNLINIKYTLATETHHLLVHLLK